MKTKRFIVDTLALNIFVLFSAFIVEVMVSGIDLPTFIKGRALMILPNTLTVTPYNKTRTALNTALSKQISSSFHRQVIRDTLVFILFRVPLVFIVLTALGAPLHKVALACLTATLISGFTGWPYGIFIDYVRKICKVAA